MNAVTRSLLAAILTVAILLCIIIVVTWLRSAHSPPQAILPVTQQVTPTLVDTNTPTPLRPSSTAPTAVQQIEYPTPSPVIPLSKYGIHLLLDDDRGHWAPEVWPQHVKAARQLVGRGGYVLQLVRLDDLDPERWQFFFDLCQQEDVIPIMRLATTFDHEHKWWAAPPQDPGSSDYMLVAQQVQRFMAQLRWPSAPRYVIIGNEPNRGDEWSNQPDPAQYAAYLRDVGAALHDVGITVMGPALDLYAPHSNAKNINGYRYLDAETFLDGMYTMVPEAFDAIDVWASHAYPLDPFRFDPSRQIFQIDYANGASNPDHLPPPQGIHNRGINSYRWEIWKLEQLMGPEAADLPVFVTESGWRHTVTQDPSARDSVHAEVSFDQMSSYVDLAFHGNQGRYPDLPQSGWIPWTNDERVLGVVLFAFAGYPPDWGHTNWAIVDEKGQITGIYPIGLSK